MADRQSDRPRGRPAGRPYSRSRSRSGDRSSSRMSEGDSNRGRRGDYQQRGRDDSRGGAPYDPRRRDESAGRPPYERGGGGGSERGGYTAPECNTIFCFYGFYFFYLKNLFISKKFSALNYF